MYSMQMLNDLAKQIRFDNASKGFDPLEGGIERYLLLVISELVEAQEELRDGRSVTEIYYEDASPLQKPCGFPVEVVDAIIRIMDIMAKMEWDILEIEYPEWISHDSDVTVDAELLAVCEYIAMCYRKKTDKADRLNVALKALFILLNSFEIDVLVVMREKLEFNKSRPPKHGRKF